VTEGWEIGCFKESYGGCFMMIYHQYKMPTHSLSCPYRLIGTSYAGQWQCLFSFFSVFSATQETLCFF